MRKIVLFSKSAWVNHPWVSHLDLFIKSRFAQGTLCRQRLLLIAFVVAATSSCATQSPKGEVVDASVLNFQQGEAEVGVPVRWGGTIANVVNKQDVTVLEIVARPLLRTGQPYHNDQSDGRFLAEISGFVDPEIVSRGRDITMVGTVTKIEEGLIGEAEYQFPVMASIDFRIWKTASEINQQNVYPRNRHYLHPHDIYYDPYWGRWPYGRRGRIRGIITY